MLLKKALIYPKDCPQAELLCQQLREAGCDASFLRDGEVREEADLLVLCPNLGALEALDDGEIGSGHDFDRMERLLSAQLSGMKRCIDSAVPFLSTGGKRIAFLTEEASSISRCKDRDRFAEHMLLSAVNMLAKMTFNRLRPLGFTVRCFAPSPGLTAAQYILQDFCFDANEPTVHSEENRLVLRNGSFVEIPW